MNIDQEVTFTKNWWNEITKDSPRLISWLQKLQVTEREGYTDYLSYIDLFNPDDRTCTILRNIAEDELKHAGLITELLIDRGYALNPQSPKSHYWSSMNDHIIDMKTAAAVNYFGESLAAFRFEVILYQRNTPQDIRELLSIVLPDEQFHQKTLRHIAGEDAISLIQAHHITASNQLKQK